MQTRIFTITIECSDNASSYIDAVVVRQVLLDVPWLGNNKHITNIGVEETKPEQHIDDVVINEGELYPGHREESRRNSVVERAVQAADRIIMDGTDGTTAGTDYLTGEVMMKFSQKVQDRLQQRLLTK